MKHIFLLLVFFALTTIGKAQTWGSRNDAGLRGDAGAVAGFFETADPVNYPTGASSWWHLLDVRHSNPSNNFSMQFAGSFFDQHLYFRKTINNPTQQWSKVLLETDGKVGIGTTNPLNKLHVNGIMRWGGDDSYIYSGEDGLGGYLEHRSNSISSNALRIQTKKIGVEQYAVFKSDAYKGFSFYTYGGGNANVGIGTDTPTEKLSVYGENNINPGVISLESSRNDAGDVEVGSIRAKNSSGEIARIGMLRAGESYSGFLNFMVKTNNSSVLFEAARITENGNVGIGTTTPTEKLAVNGKIRAKEIRIETTGWPDYVFDKGYKVEKLSELESYIKANKHLPEVPSAKEVAANGLELGEMNKILLKKIEELTLHLIEKDKKITNLENLNTINSNAIKQVLDRVAQLEKNKL